MAKKSQEKQEGICIIPGITGTTPVVPEPAFTGIVPGTQGKKVKYGPKTKGHK